MTRTLLLVDGEHYPPVIEAAFPGLIRDGLEPVAAVFLGGFEKTGAPPILPVPVRTGDPFSLIPSMVRELGIEMVFDLSDEPVLDARSRFVLAGLALANGAAYGGGGFRFDPPHRPQLTELPTVAVVGTGKRTGKTAVAIELARYWRGTGMRPCIVTMGRGGPPEPLVLEAESIGDPRELITRLGRDGLHATSDYVEDAIFAGVDTVGTRRLGAGPAGVTVEDTFAAGVAAACELEPDLLIFEGSGTAVPPAAADATVLVSRADLDPEFLVGYLGSYRLGIADVMVVLGEGSDRLAREVARIRPDLPVRRIGFRPEVTVPVDGRSVVLVTTAPVSAGARLEAELAQQGAARVETIHVLSDRRRLAGALSGLDAGDLVVTEIKAAAADVVLPAADRAGADVAFLHNRVEVDDGIEALVGLLERSMTLPVRP